MATYKYLDKTGLGQVWSKIKNTYLEVFVVNIDQYNGTLIADKTYSEINNAFLYNKPIVFRYLGYTAFAAKYDYDRYWDFYAEFYWTDVSVEEEGTSFNGSNVKTVVVIHRDNTITKSGITYYQYNHAPEDDTNVLNLLTEFGYSAPVVDADNKIITDADNNIILG